MNTTGRRIFKNASVLMASQFTTWGLSMAIMIFMSRYLGAVGLGQIHLASSIWSIMSIFISFGMNTHLTKEIARKPAETGRLLSLSVAMRTLMFVLSLGIVFIYSQVAGYSEITVAVILVMGFINLLGEFASTCQASLAGLERMEYTSLAQIVSRTFSAVLTILLLVLGYNVIVVVSVGIGAGLINLGLQLYYLRRLAPLQAYFRWSEGISLLKSSFPYLAVFAFITLYMQVDIIVISLVANEQGVGWYSAADQLFGTLLFIPSIFLTAVFPALARMYADASDSLPRLMSKSFNLLLLLSVPVGLGVLTIANPLVVMLFGAEFANSGPILAVMGIVLLLTYQNMMLGQFLISIDRQKDWMWVMAGATVATVGLDIVLIPWCQRVFNNGALGGALAFVVTESAMLIIGLRLLPAGVITWQSSQRSLRAVLAGLGMVGVIWWARDLFIAIPVAIGAVSYIGFLLLLRVVPPEDWAMLKSLAHAVSGRLRKRNVQPVS